jgi:hypothetical protein
MVTAEQILAGIPLAQDASQAQSLKQGGPRAYCGFAWVEVNVGRTNSRQAKELIRAGFKKDWKPKYLSMWNPGGHPTQCMMIKEAGADAFANYLTVLGLDAMAHSRPD